MDIEIIERLTKVEQSEKSAHHRLDEHDEQLKELSNVYVALIKVDDKVTNVENDVSEMKSDIKDIKEKPLKEYEETKSQIKKQVISFFVGIGLTALAFALGLSKYM